MPRLAYKKSMSLGEAISSVCFFGVGVVWLSQGMDMIDAGSLLARGWLIYLRIGLPCCLFSLCHSKHVVQTLCRVR